MYTTKRYSTTISVNEYVENYVDVETFLECCKACSSYDNAWSCPPYDFNVIEYWKKFSTLELTAVKIIFDVEYAGKTFSPEEMKKITKASLGKVKAQLTQELLEREKQSPGSISLSAGSCALCKEGCTRKDHEPCRFPDKMRYSIEALGGNVGLTISKLMGIELEWMEEDKLPAFYVLVCGLLTR